MTDTPCKALITGASSGIGREYSIQLAGRCDEIVITGRQQAKLQRVADEVRAAGARCEVVIADLGTTIGIARLAETIRQRGPLRYLINCAGFGTTEPFIRQDPAVRDSMITLHIGATLQLSLAALGGMAAEGGGALVNVSSIGALAPSRSLAVYGGSKAFLNNFSEALQQEVARQSIKVQCLCPGYTRSDFLNTEHFAGFDPATIPDALWMDADEVVSESLAALDQPDSPVLVVPGEVNRQMVRDLLARQLAAFQ